MKILPWLISAICCILISDNAFAQVNLNAQAGQETIVFQRDLPFQKNLSQKRTLVVVEKEIPYKPPSEAKRLPPNVQFTKPDHVYLYTFELRSGHKMQVLWSHEKNYFIEWRHSLSPSLKVLDAIISQGKLCVVYQDEGIVFANVITPGASLDKPLVGWIDAELLEQSDLRSARILGSLSKSDLVVELLCSDRKRLRYHLQKDQWVDEPSLPILINADRNVNPVINSGAKGQRSVLKPSASSHPQTTQAKFETLAAHLEFFDLVPFVYNRTELNFRPADPRAAKRYFQVLHQVLDPEIPVAEITPLCRHENPKVRTLALAALFQRNDPHMLPLINDHIGDTAQTFDGYMMLSQTWLHSTGIGPPPQKQSVGDVAAAMVNFYLERAGDYSGAAGSQGKSGAAEFADYWAQRMNRRFCAS